MVSGNTNAPRKKNVEDYQFGTRIGEGSYSTVYSALDVQTNKTFAIKVLSKKHIVKEDKIKYVNIEKTTLHRLGQQHPGIVQLYYTFQDESSLFFVLDFAEYGELLSIIRKFGSLSEQVLKFYMCQILDAVKFIHLKGVIHRDLKPENILVGYDFNLKITDFGAAKLLGSTNGETGEKIDYNGINQDTAGIHEHDRRGSFVGTAEYVPPELLKHNSCGYESDLWALGCVLYQFFHGNPPFKGATEYLTFEKIINVNYTYRSNIIPQDVIQIIDHLLVADPKQRLTISQVMESHWFRDVQWNDQKYIWGRKVPRFEPYHPNGQKSSNSTPANAPSPYMPGFKSGTNRNMNKSSSYQQLHNQIQQLDLNLVPSVGSKKTYQPATKIKKNFMPPLPKSSVDVPLTPPMQQTSYLSKGPVPNQFNGRPHHKPRQPSAQLVAQSSVGGNNMTKGIMPVAPKTPEFDSGFAKPNQSPENKGQPTNLRSNTAFANMSPQQSNNYHNRQYSTGSVQSFSKPMPNTAQAPQSHIATMAGTAAIGGYQKPNSAPPISRCSPVPPQGSSFSRPSRPSSSAPISPHLDSSKYSKTTPNSAPPIVTNNGNEKTSNGINTIMFKEIHSLLESDEKILKMDVILRLILRNKDIQRNTSQLLDDTMIEELVTKYNITLQRTSTQVITVITNKARVFFIDGSLNVMLVDLKANKGADYLMYDYEFESISVDDDDEENIVTREEVYGYLILELIRDNGDLIFLKRISDIDRKLLKSSVKVVDRDGENVTLGKRHGWIDSLLMAKEMVDLSKAATNTSTNGTKTKKPSKPASRSSLGKKQKPRAASVKSEASSNGQNNSNTLSKFAYAAAAAAHK